MKKFILLSAAILTMTSCQQPPKQYSEAGPEIDMIKKGNKAYVDRDWATLRSLYADTAKVADNVWTPDKFITVDQFIDAIKKDAENFSEVKLSDDGVYNMIVSDKGEKWVLNWINWTGKMKNGKEVSAPIHLAFRIAGDKVAFQVNFYNQLPGYLAMQPTDSTKMK